jgi:hypothetical protein
VFRGIAPGESMQQGVHGLPDEQTRNRREGLRECL